METMELDRLVEAATSHLEPQERINLAKSTWLAGQFLGEMCDYEPGTTLIKHAKRLCPSRQKALLYQISFSLGNVYYYKVDWEKARSNFTPHHPLLVITPITPYSLPIYQVDWEKARSSFTEALRELKSWATPQDEKLEEQCALHNITVSCLIIMKRLDEAERVLSETESKYTRLPNYRRSPGYWMYLFQKSRYLTKRAQKISTDDKSRAEERGALFTEAQSILRDTLNFMMKNYGWRHPLVAQTWQEKGFLYQYAAGNHVEAESCFRRALEIYSEVLSSDHVLIATCNYHLGMIYEEMRKWEEALNCFEIALDIRQKRFTFRFKSWRDIERRRDVCRIKIDREMEGRDRYSVNCVNSYQAGQPIVV
eukprot:sb/3465886/